MSLLPRLRERLRTVLVCCVLEFGAMIGLPMRPDEIVALMHTMNQPTIVRTTPDENTSGDDIATERVDSSATRGQS
jgi:hypothetical protein